MKTFADFGIQLGNQAGVEVATTCPQCSPTRKKSKARCLSVNTEKAVWHCNHCSWAGTLKHGEQERSTKPKLIVKPTYTPSPDPAQKLLTWFASRGIPESLVREYRISLQTAYMPQLEAEVPCITFPYVKNGEVVNIKFRTLEGKHFRQIPHAEKVLYGVDDVSETWTVIVEGELDKLALVVAGIRHVVSVPDGAPPPNAKPTDQKFEYLTNCAEQLDRLDKIILAVDNDPAGKTLEADLARRLGPERCWRVTWPEGCKDANDVLLRHGAEELRTCVDAAVPYPLEGVLSVSDVAEDVLQLYREGLPGGLSTGWYSVNAYYTVRPGELTIVTGVPSHGKSQFLDALTVNLARLHGWSFGVCSPENIPVQRHIAKLSEQYTGFPFREGPTLRISQPDLVQALTWLHEHFIFIVPDETLTIPQLLDHGKRLVRRFGIRGLVIDPWNEFDHSRPANKTETEYISESLGQIRRFARNHGVHVWLVAHPQKLYRRENGSYPVPTPYDISGSAHWRNKADNCLTIWRDMEDPEALIQLHVQKVRFREVGQVGVVELGWNKKNGRYEEVEG